MDNKITRVQIKRISEDGSIPLWISWGDFMSQMADYVTGCDENGLTTYGIQTLGGSEYYILDMEIAINE